ncbi:TPA: prophage tail fiber N-terminal domain-containing protein [Escherichia coli]|nr:prophage tail fiber N-terminal domain-containing protein [Escherichia coli]
MTIRLYGILTDGLNKPIVNATVSLIARSNTLIVLGSSEAIFRTDPQGAYNITMNPGHYVVIVGPQGKEPYKAGEIVLYADSPDGSLNGYLVNWVEEELTPDVIKQVQQLVAASEEYSLQAGRSAAAANADATDARNSKASAAQSASDALVYKNDAKASEDAARQAQAGAAGSANTASQAVTTIQGLKSDVEQLKADTQGIKDAAVSETTALKDAAAASAAQASNSATEAGQQASNAAGSAQSASTDAGRAEVAAGKAEGIISKSLLKENNLSDLPDKDQARFQLKIHTFRSLSEQTLAYSPDNSIALRILNNEWGGCTVSDGRPKPLTVEYGGTGVASKEDFRQSYNVPTKDESLLSENNLSDLADRAAAWLNVRPIGSTPLSGDPTEDMDATTKHWVEEKIVSDIEDSFAKGVNTTECIATNNASSTPVAGLLINGGKIESVYSINGERVYSSTFENTGWYGQTILTRLTTKHYQTSSEASWDFELNGILRSKKAMRAAGTTGATYLTAYQVAPVWLDGPYSGYSGIVGGGFGTTGGGWRNFISFGSIIYPNEGQAHPNAVIVQCWDYDFSSGESTGALTRITTFNSTTYDITFSRNDGAESYVFSRSPNSDRTLKRDIKAIDTSIALSNIEKMEYCSFIYTNDKKEQVRRGFIAQQLQEIDPQYIRSYENTPGSDKRILCLDENVLLLDAIAAIKTLNNKVNELEQELSELKQLVNKLVKTEDLP